MLRVEQVGLENLQLLSARYGLELCLVAAGEPIPGSFWGEPEAGLVGSRVYARPDTPLHSLLHESCHLIVMGSARRSTVMGDAGGGDLEECAVCYLQLLLADELGGTSARRLAGDMDSWGYSFRLGSTWAWFEQDADDARAWLTVRGLLSADGRPSFEAKD